MEPAIDLYAEFLSAGKSGGGQEEDDDGARWRAEFMAGRREKILSGKPYIEFDWDSLKTALLRGARS